MKHQALFSVGEFSRITGLTVKTLHHYHEIQLLVPSIINSETRYRYYNHSDVEKARAILLLRDLQIPLEEIKKLMCQFQEESELIPFLETHRLTLEKKIQQLRTASNHIQLLIQTQQEGHAMSQNSSFEVNERKVEGLLIAGIRWKGRYSDCGSKFKELGRKAGRYIHGKAMNLYYDLEFKETDADIETCFPIRKSFEAEGIHVHTLDPIFCLSLIHEGPYEEINRSYEKIMAAIKEKNLKISGPIREIYLKGPGMIFKGNPKKYLTEIQIPINRS